MNGAGCVCVCVCVCVKEGWVDYGAFGIDRF